MARVSSLACLPCRKRHVKCPGGDPCANCSSTSRACEYKKSRRGGYRVPRKLQHLQAGEQVLTPPTPSYEELPFFAEAEGSHWETVYNGYYDLFHSKHPFLPAKESNYVNRLFSAPELRAAMALVVHILTSERPREKDLLRAHILSVEETIDQSPEDDTVKLQALILLAITSHMSMHPDISLRSRARAWRILRDDTTAESLVSQRMVGTAPEVCIRMTLEAIHELYFVDVMIEAAFGRASVHCVDIARFEKPAIWPYNEPQVSEVTKLRYECVSLVRKLASMAIPPEEAQTHAMMWQDTISSRIAKGGTTVPDERLVLASLCADFGIIMSTMHNSTLQSCASACDVSQPTQPSQDNISKRSTKDEPSAMFKQLNTAAMVKAANNMVRTAANTARDPFSPAIVANAHSPLLTCGFAMCLLIHLKFYNEKQEQQHQALIAHYLLQVQSSIEYECACLDALGAHWPLAAEIISRMRLLILHHVPPLYAYSIGTASASSDLISPPTGSSTASNKDEANNNTGPIDVEAEIDGLPSLDMAQFFDQLFDFEAIA